MAFHLLAGSDPANKDWIERVAPLLSSKFRGTKIQEYQHWKSGGTLNLNQEVSTLLASLEADTTPVGVFAKSAGILIALEALAETAEPPLFAIFCGLPLTMAEAMDLDIVELLETIDYPVLFIQNAHDHAGSAEEVRMITGRIETAEFLLLPGSGHDYPIVGMTQEAIEDFIEDHTD
ncbi:hypothetical protein COW46_02465 [Candidatus Gracilibacteria bacterium CG17_big_fil_post_rev_8_21_14_2_50_48_13]|nr:MAG: hypothetical protein COW46_02465 [Candidatus Gracilibacteria bacterium CG17_big_fil_post_rev_8_21_14_2_50_48_13]